LIRRNLRIGTRISFLAASGNASAWQSPGAGPAILLMDEPFGAIDRIARERLQNEFLGSSGKCARPSSSVTHDIDEAIKLGDRIAIMNAGRLEQYDTPAGHLARPASDLVVDLLGPDAD